MDELVSVHYSELLRIKKKRSLTGSVAMTRMLLTLGAATAFVVASFGAWAQNANDGPKYPNMESHKHYKDVRNLDHNNPSPRYAVTTTQGVGQASPARQRVRVVHTIRRQAPTIHANARLVHHG